MQNSGAELIAGFAALPGPRVTAGSGVKSGPTATARDIQCRGYQVIEFHR